MKPTHGQCDQYMAEGQPCSGYQRLEADLAAAREALDESRKWHEGARQVAQLLTQRAERAEADLAAARALLIEATNRPEWGDKVIHGGDGSMSQHWVLTIYLPVPVGSAMTPRAALDAVLAGEKSNG